jgi:hypothetical protein
MNNLVLVGFGKQKLIDLIEKIGDPEEEEKLLELTLGKQLPPVYRDEKSCSQDEKIAMVEYVGWLTDLLKKYNEEEK